MSPTMIDRQIDSPAAWTGSIVASDAGRLVLDHDCLAEIETVAATLRANPLPVLVLAPADFELAHCRRAASRVKRMLEERPGFRHRGRVTSRSAAARGSRRGLLAPLFADRAAGRPEVGRHHGVRRARSRAATRQWRAA